MARPRGRLILMPKIRRTSQSWEDFTLIHSFIAEDSPQNAAEVIRAIDEKLRFLAFNPNLGLARPELAPDVRSWLVHSYVIFYHPFEDGIVLLRVLHAAMDITGQHLDENDKSKST